MALLQSFRAGVARAQRTSGARRRFVYPGRLRGVLDARWKRAGGTGQAIRIAHAHEVPVFDLGGDFEAAIGGIAALSGIDADCLLNSFAQPMPIHQKMRFG